jgi:hypothetical protein
VESLVVGTALDDLVALPQRDELGAGGDGRPRQRTTLATGVRTFLSTTAEPELPVSIRRQFEECFTARSRSSVSTPSSSADVRRAPART